MFFVTFLQDTQKYFIPPFFYLDRTHFLASGWSQTYCISCLLIIWSNWLGFKNKREKKSKMYFNMYILIIAIMSMFIFPECLWAGAEQGLRGDLQNDLWGKQRPTGEPIWSQIPKLWQTRTVQSQTGESWTECCSIEDWMWQLYYWTLHIYIEHKTNALLLIWG